MREGFWLMNENLIKREGHKQVDLFPVLKCVVALFYARNPAQGKDSVAPVTTAERQRQKDEVQKMALF